jgi:tryptophan 2,3-dioxygenase
MNREELLAAIDEKYKGMGQNPDVHLSGLLYAESMTYWDFANVDALLSLQIKRTTLPDEMVFIMYHQINELLFKMILWEIAQVSEQEGIKPEKFSMHLARVSRYFDMLSNSFDIMSEGMEVEQYMKFRDTLTPASGFQSAQYRKIEIASTELINLIDYRFRKTIDRETPYSHAFEHMYWQAAGKDYETGKKSKLMQNFEKKYRVELISFMEEYNLINLWTKFKQLPKEYQNNVELVNEMRHYDHTVNISWVMHHYNTAAKYLDSGQGSSKATGGSDWHKYMHPRYQRRIFFPELWSEEELENWGVTNLEGHQVLTEIPQRLTNSK